MHRAPRRLGSYSLEPEASDAPEMSCTGADFGASQPAQAVQAEAFHGEAAHHRTIDHRPAQRRIAGAALAGQIAHEAAGKAVASARRVMHLVQREGGNAEDQI